MASGDRSIEEARRRVYSPGATEQDRLEYRRLLEATDQVPADGAELPLEPGVPPNRRRLRYLLVGALAVVLLAPALVLSLPRPTQGGAEAVPAPTPLPVDAVTRASFLYNLNAGRAPGIAAYVRTQRAKTPLRDATRLTTIERWGTGPGSLALRPPISAPLFGRATVILVVRSSTHAGWRLSAVRSYLRSDDPRHLLGRRAGDVGAGTPTSASVRYDDDSVPRTLRIDVPQGVDWGVAVVLSD